MGLLASIESPLLQSSRVDILSLGFAILVGIAVVQMYHMAVLSNEKDNPPTVTRNARYLLKLHRAAAFSLGLLLLISKQI